MTVAKFWGIGPSSEMIISSPKKGKGGGKGGDGTGGDGGTDGGGWTGRGGKGGIGGGKKGGGEPWNAGWPTIDPLWSDVEGMVDIRETSFHPDGTYPLINRKTGVATTVSFPVTSGYTQHTTTTGDTFVRGMEILRAVGDPFTLEFVYAAYGNSGGGPLAGAVLVSHDTAYMGKNDTSSVYPWSGTVAGFVDGGTWEAAGTARVVPWWENFVAHHYCIQYDGTTLRTYIDGTLNALNKVPSGPVSNNGAGSKNLIYIPNKGRYYAARQTKGLRYAWGGFTPDPAPWGVGG